MSVSHGSERVAADVRGDDIQTRRTDADQQNNQIDLEPQGEVAGLEGGESGSQGRQCQVEHGVSHSSVCNVGDVLLKGKKTNEFGMRTDTDLYWLPLSFWAVLKIDLSCYTLTCIVKMTKV